MKKSTSVWKGYISFGLVSIDIELYTVVQEHVFGFQLLHAPCKSPINYERKCTECNQKVEWSAVVKGLKLSNGKYFIVTKEYLAQLRPEKTDFIEIVEFVPREAIDLIYYDEHYYVFPAKNKDKAFFLLEAVLAKSNKVAIGQFVMRDKQYICALQPYGSILLLTTLNYAYEIRDTAAIRPVKTVSVTKAELALAQQLVHKLSVKKFDVSQFKDTFAQELKKEIQAAQKGRKTKVTQVKKKSASKKEKDTLEHMLRKSVTNKKKPSQQPAIHAKRAKKRKK